MLFDEYGSAQSGAVLAVSQPEHTFVSGPIADLARTRLRHRLVR